MTCNIFIITILDFIIWAVYTYLSVPVELFGVNIMAVFIMSCTHHWLIT